MVAISELTPYENYDLNNISNILQNDYDIAQGRTYSISEIRKAVSQYQPAFVRVGKGLTGQTLFIVGESTNILVAHKGNELFELSDKELKKSWTGEAVIILDKKNEIIRKSIVIEDNPDEPKKVSHEFVIFPSERDTWKLDHSDRKRISKEQIQRINDLDLYYLPAHPVIILFCTPSEKILKDGIRAANNGVEIQIYDPTDPFTEFLHELGHIYWNTRLSPEEKMVFSDLQKNLPKEKPAIFIADWDSENGEEVFSTVYLWYMKGASLHNGYWKILEQQYPEGMEAIVKIFVRVKSSIATEITTKAKKLSVEKIWRENEKDISIWLNNLAGTPSRNYVKGKGILKSFLPSPPILSYEFPVSIPHKVIGGYQGRDWVYIESGILQGKIIVLKAGCLDVNYMQNCKNIGKAPVKIVSRYNGKKYNRTIFKSYTPLMIDNYKAAIPLEENHHVKIPSRQRVLQKLLKIFGKG